MYCLQIKHIYIYIIQLTEIFDLITPTLNTMDQTTHRIKSYFKFCHCVNCPTEKNYKMFEKKKIICRCIQILDMHTAPNTALDMHTAPNTAL